MNKDRQSFYQKMGLGLVLASLLGTSHADILQNPTDLFLNIYDMTTANSYNVDLGISMTAFIKSTNAGGSVSYNLGSAYLGIAGDSLEYNIAAADLSDSGLITKPFNDPTYGFIISSPNSSGYEAPNSITINQLQSGIRNPVARVGAIETAAFDTVLTSANGGLSAGFHVQWDLNSTLGNSTSAVSSATGLDEHGNYAGNVLYIQAVTSPGITTYGGSLSTITTNTKANISTLQGYFTLTSTGLDWVSSVSAGTTSAVPLPAASWLFLGGLAGLLKLQKRKQA